MNYYVSQEAGSITRCQEQQRQYLLYFYSARCCSHIPTMLYLILTSQKKRIKLEMLGVGGLTVRTEVHSGQMSCQGSTVCPRSLGPIYKVTYYNHRGQDFQDRQKVVGRQQTFLFCNDTISKQLLLFSRSVNKPRTIFSLGIFIFLFYSLKAFMSQILVNFPCYHFRPDSLANQSLYLTYSLCPFMFSLFFSICVHYCAPMESLSCLQGKSLKTISQKYFNLNTDNYRKCFIRLLLVFLLNI